MTYPPVEAVLRANSSQAVEATAAFQRALAELQAVFGEVAEASARLDAAMEGTARALLAARDEMTYLGAEAGGLSERLAVVDTDASGLSRSVQGLSRSTRTLADGMAASADATSAFGERFGQLDADLGGVERQVSVLSTEMGSLRTSMAESAAAATAMADSLERVTVSEGKVAASTVVSKNSMSEMRSALLMVGGALGVLDFEFAKSAGNFQEQTTRMQTEAGLTDQAVVQFAGSMSGLQSKILDVATATGTSGTEMAKAMYEPVSAGLQLSQALDVARYSAEEAKISGADLESTTTSLTAVMKNFGSSIASPEQGMATLNAIVGTGMGRFQDFNESLKNWAPTAASFGVSLDSVGAALAYMTDRGESFQTAGTKVNLIMAQLVGQTNQAGKLMEGLGLSTDQVTSSQQAMQQAMESAHIRTSTLADDLRRPDGLVVALRDLQTHLIGAGLSADAANSVMVRAFGGAKTFRGLAELMNDLDGLQAKFEQVSHDENVAHFEEQWVRASQSFNMQWATMVASIQNFMIKVGSDVLPVVGRIVSAFGDMFQSIASHKAILDAVATALTTLGIALPIVSIGMFIAKMGETATAVTVATGKLALFGAGLQYGLSNADSFTGQLVLTVTGLMGAANAVNLLGDTVGNLGGWFSKQAGAVRAFAGTVSEAEGMIGKTKAIGAGLLDLLSGPWGLVLTAAAVGIALFASSSNDASQAVDDLTNAIRQDSGALGENADKWAMHALDQDGALQAAKDLGLSTRDVTNALLQQGKPLDDLKAKLNDIVAAHDKIDSSGESMDNMAQAAFKLLDSINKNKDAVKAAQDAYKLQAEATSQSTAVLNANASAAIGTASSSLALYSSSNDLTTAQDNVTKALNATKDAASKLTDQLTLLNGGNIDATKADIAFRDSADALTKSMTTNGHSLDENTDSGRKNMKSFLDAAAAAATHAEAVAKQTGDVTKGTQAFNDDVKALQDVMAKSGFTRDEINRLTDAYLKVPHDLETTPHLNSGPALAEAHSLVTTINGMRAVINVSASGVSSIGSGLGRVAWEATGGQVSRFAGGGVARFPGGGPVLGMGTESSDSIPAMLSDDEYVVRARAVHDVGLPVLDAINTGDLTAARDLLDLMPGVSSAALGAGLPLADVGSQVVNNYIVNVTVQGTVAAERDLVEAIRTEMLQIGTRMPSTYANYKR